MRSKRALALAMAGAMMAGAFATAMPVMAEGNTTQVTLTVAPKNTYTMTVPATTTLDLSGSVTALQNGVTISSDNDMADGYAVNVTASSENDWKLKSSSGTNTNTIGYTLYSDSAGTVEMDGKGTTRGYKLDIYDGTSTISTTAAKGLWFTAEDANHADGTVKNVYAKVNTDDIEKAASGDYTDTITFTAEVGKTVTAKITGYNCYNQTIITNKYYSYTVLEGTKWTEIFLGEDKIDGALYQDQNFWLHISVDGHEGHFIYVDDYNTSYSTKSVENGDYQMYDVHE